LVEREPSKLGVAGSSPVSRSKLLVLGTGKVPLNGRMDRVSGTPQAIASYAQVAQSVEHVLGKDEVGGSIPLLGFIRLRFGESEAVRFTL
jgi:hypothetical protein